MKEVIERLYACSSILNSAGQYAYYGRVGGCPITGNEGGAEHCAMNVVYSLRQLIRRGARIATRVHGDLIRVHVRADDGTAQAAPPRPAGPARAAA